MRKIIKTAGPKNHWKKTYNKFGAIKSGSYHSKKEHKRALQLKLLERIEEIQRLTEQPKFLLQEAFRNNQGKAIRKLEYIADFQYFDNNKNCWIVEDSKGFKTPDYRIKAKLFQFKYPDFIFIES